MPDFVTAFTAPPERKPYWAGTALVSTQVRSLRRHIERIVVNFDPDQAGVNAAERSIQILLDENMRVRVLELEGDDDPDEYIKKNGLQDKKNKRMINADPALKEVFGGKSTVSMFEMTKLVSKHLK